MRFYALMAAALVTTFLAVMVVKQGLPFLSSFTAQPKSTGKPMLTEIEAERLRLYPESMKPPPSNTKRSMTEADSLAYLEESELQHAREGRSRQRASALEKLRRPLSHLCHLDERPQMLLSIREYYYHRLNSIERKYDWAGVAAAKFMMQRYETPEDHQVDQALREAFKGGYIKVADFNQYERRLIGRIVQNDKVTGYGC
jgi:hypothetical protein